MDRFGEDIVRRLRELERPQAWLARKVGRSPSMLHHYINGKRPWKEDIKLRVEGILDIRDSEAEVA